MRHAWALSHARSRLSPTEAKPPTPTPKLPESLRQPQATPIEDERRRPRSPRARLMALSSCDCADGVPGGRRSAGSRRPRGTQPRPSPSNRPHGHPRIPSRRGRPAPGFPAGPGHRSGTPRYGGRRRLRRRSVQPKPFSTPKDQDNGRGRRVKPASPTPPPASTTERKEAKKESEQNEGESVPQTEHPNPNATKKRPPHRSKKLSEKEKKNRSFKDEQKRRMKSFYSQRGSVRRGRGRPAGEAGENPHNLATLKKKNGSPARPIRKKRSATNNQARPCTSFRLPFSSSPPVPREETQALKSKTGLKDGKPPKQKRHITRNPEKGNHSSQKYDTSERHP